MSKDLILGIDPGASGALALYRAADGYLVHVFDMPTHTIRINGSDKKRVDPHGLSTMVNHWRGRIAFAVIEEVSSLPKQGVASTFAFGQAYMAVEMACAALHLPYYTVTPAVWKRVMKCSGDKDESRRAASRLMPDASQHWARVKDDGRAEAALLAVYGLRVFGKNHGMAPGATEEPANEPDGGLLS